MELLFIVVPKGFEGMMVEKMSNMQVLPWDVGAQREQSVLTKGGGGHIGATGPLPQKRLLFCVDS